MALLEKIKINLDYLLGKADSSLYAEPYKSQNLTSEDWQKRWETFSDEDSGFIWYGVDDEGNIAEFCSEEAYVPEAFFQSVAANKKLLNFFENLPEITTSVVPQNLHPELKKIAMDLQNLKAFWGSGANTGLFIFGESTIINFNGNAGKPLYELELIPKEPLKIAKLPSDIQELLKPYHFGNLRFADCQHLDVSEYFYCEK